MTQQEIALLRQANQKIVRSDIKNVRELAGWMGAMQAQDYSMVKWAAGVRLPGSSEKTIEDALDRGDVIRTHLLRPTWHIVAAEDLSWILRLTAPHIKATMGYRNNSLEITPAILQKTAKIISDSLTGGNHMTREELIAEFRSAGIRTDENRASHIFGWAELEGIICSGRKKGKKITYALISERVPDTPPLTHEESLQRLALSYFRSHGPASLPDFIWWSGLPAREAKTALSLASASLSELKLENVTYWFRDNAGSPPEKENVCLLPAYDEFLISYRDRSAMLQLSHHKRAISINGIFKPTIVVNGQVAGLWKRTVKGTKVLIETEFFAKPAASLKKAVESKMEEYSRFLAIHTA